MSIRVECPHCGKGINAPSKYAGKTAKCPACQKAIQIPAPVAKERVTVPPEPPPVPTPAPPSVEEPQAHAPPRDAEQDVLKVNPAMFRTRPFATAFITLALLASTGVAIEVSSDAPAIWGLPLTFLFILSLWFLQSRTTSLTVTTKRSILRHGILSKRTREVRHSDVRLLQVDQSFFQRLLAVGKLSIASAGHGDVEIMVNGLAKPQAIKEMIDKYR